MKNELTLSDICYLVTIVVDLQHRTQNSTPVDCRRGHEPNSRDWIFSSFLEMLFSSFSSVFEDFSSNLDACRFQDDLYFSSETRKVEP